MSRGAAEDSFTAPRLEQHDDVAASLTSSKVQQRPADQTFCQRHFIRILGEWLRAFESRLTGLGSECFVDALSGEHLFDLRQPPRNGSDAAEHDTRAAANLL